MYNTYVEKFLKLISVGKTDLVKDVIYARLNGEKQPVHNLVSPPLSREEVDENALFYYIYEKLERDKKDTELKTLRRAVLELLMDAFYKKESLLIIDALGQMAGFFQVSQFPSLSEQLRLQLWGYMNTRLGKAPGYKPFVDMMKLETDDMEYACRALDLWLTLTPPLPPDQDAHYYKTIIELFENSMESDLQSQLQFYLLILIFRAAIKVKPYDTGRNLFYRMCKRLETQEIPGASNFIRNGWYGFCNEMGLSFEYNESVGQEWKEKFIKGIHEKIKTMVQNPRDLNNPFFWESLSKMNGLDKVLQSYSIKNVDNESFEKERKAIPDSFFNFKKTVITY